MLPSTGLFNNIPCPYYDGGVSKGEGSCCRPYCHFKHVKKDEGEAVASKSTPVPEYKPTPKLLTLSDTLATPSLKKSKNTELEYRPEKPELNSSSGRHSSVSLLNTSAPVYVPSCSKALNTIDLCSSTEDIDELNELLKEEEALVAVAAEVQIKTELVTEDSALEDVINVPEIKVEKEVKVEKNEKSEKDKDKESELHGRSEKRESRTRSSKREHRSEHRRDHHASSSTSRHRHKSSSSSKEREAGKESKSKRAHVTSEKGERRDGEKRRSSREKEREREKSREHNRDRDVDKRNSSHRRSGASSHKKSSASATASINHKSHGSSSSSRHKHSSTSRKSRRSSVSKENKSKSEARSSKSTEKENSLSRDPSSSKKGNPKHEDESPFGKVEELFATTEEDVMKECEMVYDQLEQEFATMHENKEKEAKKSEASSLKRKDISNEQELEAPVVQKKRVAYENAEKYRSKTFVVPAKTNHFRNAMQAIYHRQEVLHNNQLKEAAEAEVALHKAEEDVEKANEALEQAKNKNLTPLIPKAYLSAPSKINSRFITPVANILALERAKKKVEELKAEKAGTMMTFTTAHNAKGTPRVAHKPTTSSTISTNENPQKPPVLESTSTKISFNIRMQYYEMMVKHCAIIYPNEADSWERAQVEELAVFKKCKTPVIYKSSALLAINKLRKEAADAGNKVNRTDRIVSHEVILAGKLAQSTSWSVQKKMKTESTMGCEPFDRLFSEKAYELVYDLRLSEDLLVANGFPRPGGRPGTAVLTHYKPMRRPNEKERYCCRCGKVFSLSVYDETCVDECIYHPKSTGYRRGFVDNQHRCCQQPAGTPGCTYANYHVTDYVDADNLTGYVTTIKKDKGCEPNKKDIYALDCEMCYTTHGIELTRVTVVDVNSQTVYNGLVKPDNRIVDYNTTYSGITEEMLENEARSLRDVQAVLMSMFDSSTILIGHSLESDLKALKLIHNVVVDTSVLFPHKLGPPKKRALKTLCIENLKRIIQESESGHDSAEDAEVCIQLVKFYLRNKIS